MLAIEALSRISLAAAPAPATTAAQDTPVIRVPEDVVSKFDVEYVTETIEEVVDRKLKDEVLENEEAFYVIDLAKVLDQYKQWVKFLPRVKPYYAVKVRFFKTCNFAFNRVSGKFRRLPMLSIFCSSADCWFSVTQIT